MPETSALPTGRRVVLTEFGETPLEAVERFLHLEDQVPPAPGPGEVLLRVRACAVGWVDLIMSSGQYQHMAVPPYARGAGGNMALHRRQHANAQRSGVCWSLTRWGRDLASALAFLVACGPRPSSPLADGPLVGEVCVEAPLSTALCPVPDCALPCASRDERVSCCIETFGIEVNDERHARCLAHAHGLGPGLAECIVQEENDHFAVLNVTYQPACGEYGPIGGQDYAIRRSGSLGARGNGPVKRRGIAQNRVQPGLRQLAEA